MKILRVFVIILLILLSNSNPIFAILPCVPNPNIEEDCTGGYYPSDFNGYNSSEGSPSYLENILLVSIPIVLLVVLSILIYRRNKKGKELGLDKRK